MPEAAARPRRGDQRIRGLPPTFTSGQARAAGVSPRDLYAARDRALIVELSRGVYRLSAAPESAHLDLLAVALRVPSSVVCLDSALAIHELVDDIPSAIHIAVARGRHVPKIEYPVVEVARFDSTTFELGVGMFEAAPSEFVRVYGQARSVVDAMRLRHRIGADMAMQALGRYLRSKGQRGVADLLDLARRLHVEGPIRSAVGAVLS